MQQRLTTGPGHTSLLEKTKKKNKPSNHKNKNQKSETSNNNKTNKKSSVSSQKPGTETASTGFQGGGVVVGSSAERCGQTEGRLPISGVRDSSVGDGDRPPTSSHQQNTESSPPWSPVCRHAVTDRAFNYKLTKIISQQIAQVTS